MHAMLDTKIMVGILEFQGSLADSNADYFRGI
jgi:hypothetical protein